MRLSSMHKIVIGLVSLAAIVGGGFYLHTTQTSQPDTNSNGGDMVVCTMEAKLCPDGVTYVGRQGPTCEFAACPTVATSTHSGIPDSDILARITVRMGQKQGTMGVFVTPQLLVEDSRCPSDPNVRCIQAGTVKVKAQVTSGLGMGDIVFELNKPTTTEAAQITLVAVIPEKHAGITVAPEQYTFVFEVRPKL